MKKDTIGEMIANAVSHGIGFLLAITGLILLIIKASTPAALISSIIFGLSMMLLYISSTLFHSFPIKMKRVYTVFQRLDHASIYLLISGTYTPFLLLVVQSTLGYILLATLWILTMTGVVFKSIWIDKMKIIHLVIYLFMGWSVLFVSHDFFSNMDSITFVLLGGISYTLGVAFYISKFRYAHFVWHLFVLGGSLMHFFAIYQII